MFQVRKQLIELWLFELEQRLHSLKEWFQTEVDIDWERLASSSWSVLPCERI